MNAYRGPPMTLGNAAAARVRLIVWCLDCRHQVEPDPAEMAARGACPWQRTGGAEMTVPDWHQRLAGGYSAAVGGSISSAPASGGRRWLPRRRRRPLAGR